MKTRLVPMTLNDYSEYYRKCAYCYDDFMANHQLRRFCPSKYGVVNYCKNRYKVLKEAADIVKQAEGNQSASIDNDNIDTLPNAPPLAVNVISKSVKITPVNPTIRAKNLESLGLLIGDKKERKLSFEELDTLGYKFDTYDSLKPIPHTLLFRLEIGQYTLFWTKKNEFLLTLTTEVLWI
ncbi:MAG TPA: hypothetical protein PLN13_11795 [Bacteroidia bacterium]|nr:hypothetical protein [Bacteroidia bacterium]HRH09257.1 hypothetical protein [Bacteroidia bacterium]